MDHPLVTRSWLIALVLIPFGTSEALDPSEWRYYSPILSSQTRPLKGEEADRMLARFCETPVRPFGIHGHVTCTTRQLGRGFSDINDRTFHPKGVIFGHFLGPESDDAAVSGSSVEGHPARWGGTLLLSRRHGAWIPMWYRSRMIIDICEKIVLPDRREILLCEDEDSGMGHAFHDLYSVDFAHPADLEHSLLAEADTFDDYCATQKQVTKRVQWSPDKLGFTVEVDTSGWKRHANDCTNNTRPPASLRLRFEVTNEGLRKREDS
jgi:hypothetical protein